MLPRSGIVASLTADVLLWSDEHRCLVFIFPNGRADACVKVTSVFSVPDPELYKTS